MFPHLSPTKSHQFWPQNPKIPPRIASRISNPASTPTHRTTVILPDVRSRRNHRMSDLTEQSEPPNPSRISGFPTQPDVRRPDVRYFRTFATCRYQLRSNFVSTITNSSGVRYLRSLARWKALDILLPTKIPPISFDSIKFWQFWHLCLGLPPHHPLHHHRLPQPNHFCSP